MSDNVRTGNFGWPRRPLTAPPAPPVELGPNVLFAAVVDPSKQSASGATVVQFYVSDAVVAPEMQVGALYHLLGELRSSIRHWAAEKGNKALADAL